MYTSLTDVRLWFSSLSLSLNSHSRSISLSISIGLAYWYCGVIQCRAFEPAARIYRSETVLAKCLSPAPLASQAHRCTKENICQRRGREQPGYLLLAGHHAKVHSRESRSLSYYLLCHVALLLINYFNTKHEVWFGAIHGWSILAHTNR
jgi:hypothetical protein